MSYQEYFNYSNCSHYNKLYANYGNTSNETTHHNYDNSVNIHYNKLGIGCVTSHSNHTNYINAPHSNYMNHQSNAHTNHTNHVNYTNPNSGAPGFLTWTSPWNNTNNTLSSTYISESIDGIKEIRNNLQLISTVKSQQASAVDVASDSSTVGNAKFNDKNSATSEKVEAQQWDALRNSLNNLWSDIKGDDDNTTPAIPDKNPGHVINKSDWELLKKKVDELAGYDDSADYANTKSFATNYAHVNHSNYWNYSDSSNTPSYRNSKFFYFNFTPPPNYTETKPL